MKDNRKPRILIVDDNDAGRYSTTRILRQAGFEVQEAATGREALRLAEECPDLILLDVKLPDIGGFEVCRQIKANQRTAAIHVVHLSAMLVGGDDRAAGMEQGADGYLTQPVDPKVLVATINAFLRLKAVEQALRESEERFRRLFENSLVGLYRTAPDGRVLLANPALMAMLGCRSFDGLARQNLETHGFHPNSPWRLFKDAVERGGVIRGLESTWARADGTMVFVRESAQAVRDAAGQILFYEGVVEDITDRKRAEEEKEKLQAQLLQALRMESVGRLAGGVAHDYNNMLAVIIANAELALDKLAPSEPLYDELQEILQAARRSAEITRQLLAFARKQVISREVLDLNETVEVMLKMLRRLIGEDIDLAWLPGAGVCPVKVDPSQIDQILANLCVNARDAIAGVGKVTIETGNVAFDEAYCAEHPGFAPGEYVVLTVSDDGGGMDKETLDQLFEPFFTTKEMGKGIGLGLATVYGIVKQNNGFINVYSEPGQGATFKIYLPRHAAKVEGMRREGPPAPEVRGSETILLVEDEPAILRTTTLILERQGYTVLAASTPGEAIRLAREHAGDIHLLMTDVIMPEMNGRDLAKLLLSLYPHLRRLFMSGHPGDVVARHGVLDEGPHFIQKPFSMKGLAAKVRETLDEVLDKE